MDFGCKVHLWTRSVAEIFCGRLSAPERTKAAILVQFMAMRYTSATVRVLHLKTAEEDDDDEEEEEEWRRRNARRGGKLKMLAWKSKALTSKESACGEGYHQSFAQPNFDSERRQRMHVLEIFCPPKSCSAVYPWESLHWLGASRTNRARPPISCSFLGRCWRRLRASLTSASQHMLSQQAPPPSWERQRAPSLGWMIYDIIIDPLWSSFCLVWGCGNPVTIQEILSSLNPRTSLSS